VLSCTNIAQFCIGDEKPEDMWQVLVEPLQRVVFSQSITIVTLIVGAGIGGAVVAVIFIIIIRRKT
jgi:hypothetical protein